MSATHPDIALAPAEKRDLASRHPQLIPFLVALGIAVVSGLVPLAFAGLPA
jgi:hypothetical protein